MPNTSSQTTTQHFLDIFDITNDFLIMKNGTASVMLMVDAMNFGLLAEEEQDAVMYAYAGLLNSLNYPIQVVIQSQTKDVTNYLKLLQRQEQVATSDIMQRRIRSYREFVSNLIHDRNVLDKRFYVVIPAPPLELGFISAKSFVPGKNDFDISSVERSVILEKATNILEPKRDHLISQFARIGLYSRQLVTQEIIQLFYNSYNPEAAEGQKMTDSKSYASSLVTADVDQGILGGNQTRKPSTPAPTKPTTTSTPIAPAGQPTINMLGEVINQSAPPTLKTPTPPIQPPSPPQSAPVQVTSTQPTPQNPAPLTTQNAILIPPPIAHQPLAPTNNQQTITPNSAQNHV